MRNFRVSVVMTSFNGVQYLRAQVESIVKQLSADDELLISDDGSTDGTQTLIRELQQEYPLIRMLEGPRRGIVANFAYAIGKATGDLIFLSDQDDVWLDDKVSTVTGYFEKHPDIACIVHDVRVVDQSLTTIEPSFYAFRGSKNGLLNNLIKNSFMGSAMAIRSDMRSYILPIPEKVPMHDQWIGLVCLLFGKVVFLPDVLGLYRRHGNNASSFSRSSIHRMISNRKYLVLELLKRKFRGNGQ